MEVVLNSNHINSFDSKEVSRNPNVFGEKIGVLASIFGCWHKDLSRPFVEGKTAYRACTCCGARKKFDQNTLTTFGHFYFPPTITNVATDNQ